MSAFANGFNIGRSIYSDSRDRAMKERDLVLREQAGAREASEYEAKVAKRNEIEALKAGLRNPNTDNYALKGTGSDVGINMPAQPADTPQGDTEVTPTNYGLGSPAGGLGLRAPRGARAAPGVDATETPLPAAAGLRGGPQIPAGGATFKPRRSLADEQDVVAQIALASNDITGFNAARAAQRAYRIDDINAEVAKMTPEEIEAQSGQLNLPGTQIPVLSLGKTKGGYEYATTDPVTGQVGQRFVVSEAQRRQMVAAKRMADAGFGTESMSLLEKVDKNLAEHVSKWNQALQTAATSNNDALSKQDTVRLQERQLDQTAEYQRGVLQNQRAQIGASNRQSNKPDYALMEDANGNAVMVDKRALRADSSGVVALPPGLRLPRKNNGIEVNADGSVVKDNQLFVPDPKNPGQYVAAKGIGPSAIDNAIAAHLAKSGGVAPTGSNFTPLPKTNITARTPQGYGNPDNFERRSKRGLLGGLSYEYYDPTTGRSLSTDEYNRLIGGN